MIVGGRLRLPHFPDIIDDLIGPHHVLLLEKLFGGADDWRFVTSVPTRRRDPASHGSIGNVFTVPRQQVGHPVNCSERDMKRILLGAGRNCGI
jgi:hypothetical protein